MSNRSPSHASNQSSRQASNQAGGKPSIPEPGPPPHDVAGMAAIASANAPFIYFDSVPNYGFNGHVASLTLEIVRFTSVAGVADPQIDRVSVAHLRMTLDAMRSLKAALDGIELLAAPLASDGRN